MLFNTRSIRLIFILALFKFLVILANVICKQEGPCTCSMTDGSGVVDLKSVAKSNSPKFRIKPGTATEYGEEYLYNPCYPFTISASKNQCVSASACRYDTNTGMYENIATASSAQFDYDEATKQIYIQYRHLSSDKNISTRVYLRCSDHNVLFLTKHTTEVVNFSLWSPCNCPNGCLTVLSIGTIILIVFFSFVLTYFCVGMLYKKAVFGAVGQELIPNNDFWTALPGLIKDGYLFFISPCLGDRVEYRYYERL